MSTPHLKCPKTIYIPWKPTYRHLNNLIKLGMVVAGPKGADWYYIFWHNAPKDYEIWEINND